jgi:hypothetical protein
MSTMYRVVQICDNCNGHPVILKQGTSLKDIEGKLPEGILEEDFETATEYFEHICSECKKNKR